jgi:hypothetical protein
MAIKFPNSMEEVVYFTNRSIGDKGNAKAWAFKLTCPKCMKGVMGKPVEKGKVKIRATEYICPLCKYTEQKAEHEAKLTLSVAYTCPKCENKGEIEIPFKRKSFDGVPAFVFQCAKCNEKIGVTKKMKAPKKKGAAAVEEADDDE